MRTNFEKAAISASVNEFSDITIRGCFFHFTQCIWRKVQNLDLSTMYKDNAQVEVRKWIRWAAALPLVPLAKVDEAFLYLQENSPQGTSNEEFHDYKVETWMDEVDAVFPP